LRSPLRSATMPAMNEQPSRQRPELVRTSVPIAEAAARLGISVDAVRKRIQRGKLTGHKTDSGWTVVWIEPDIVQTDVLEPSALVDDLRDQVTYLRNQLDAEREAREAAERRHAAEIERRDVLFREALGRIPALGAGEVFAEHRAEQVSTEQAPRPWWRFWDRLSDG